MRAAVIGLGVEGKKASKSLLDHGWSVYASDLQTDINLKDLNMPITDINVTPNNTEHLNLHIFSMLLYLFEAHFHDKYDYLLLQIIFLLI